MKILLITQNLKTTDGWGRYSKDLIGGLSEGNDVKVIASPPLLSAERYLANPVRAYLAAKNIQNIIDSFDPDIVHFLVEPYVNVLPFLKIKLDTKVFLTVHGTYSFIPALFEGNILHSVSNFLIKRSYRKLTGIIAVSSYTKKYLLGKDKSFPEDKIKVITNGIDLKTFLSSSNTRENKGESSIVFVGAIKKRKGILEAIKALDVYRKKYGGNFTYTIVGSYKENDPYVKLVKSEIKNLNLENLVTFTGRLEDEQLDSIYKSADLFLMLPIQDGAFFEGFGLVYLEANSYGVAVIGSKNSGAVDAIEEGKTGYLVNPFNLNEVAGKINAILNENKINKDDCIVWGKQHDVKIKVKEVLNFYGQA